MQRTRRSGLVDHAGRAVPREEAAEMLVRGPRVFIGYWAGPCRIKGAPQDGWYRTGCLMSHPTMHDAAVLGVPDPVLGQRVAALPQLADNADIAVLNDIRTPVRTRLGDDKTPERFKVVGAAARNVLGKVERRALPALLEAWA